MTTPNLQLTEVTTADTPAAASLNDSFRSLDSTVQLAVLSQSVTAPPAGAVQGDRYIVPPTASGVWLGRTNHIAYRDPAGWTFRVPRPGWRAWSLADEALLVFDGVEWVELQTGTGDPPAPSPVGETASGARAYKNASQSIPDVTLTAISWPVESYDTDAYHDAVTPSRFTVDLDGKYIVGCAVKWDSNTAGTRAVYVVVNGVTGTRRAADFRPASNGVVTGVVDSLDLVAGDYVEFYAYQDSGGARDIVSLEECSTAFIARVGVTAAQTLMRGASFVRSVAISVPVNNVPVQCPINGTIVGVAMAGEDTAGSAVVDIWKAPDASYPPEVTDSICASAKPTITSGRRMIDNTLAGWTTTITAGDWLMFHLESSSNFKGVFVQLFIKEVQ